MMVKDGCESLTWPGRAELRAELYAAHAACEGRGLTDSVSWCAELLAGLPCEVPPIHCQLVRSVSLSLADSARYLLALAWPIFEFAR